MSASFQQVTLQLVIDRFASEPDAEIGSGEIRPPDDDQRRAVQGKLSSPPRQIGQEVAISRFDVLIGGIDLVDSPLNPGTFRRCLVAFQDRRGTLVKTGPLIDTR